MATQSDIAAGLYLEDSYLLGIVVQGRQMRLHALFALTGDHPAYVSPAQGEQHCYREGELRWDGVDVLSSQGQPRAVLMVDPDGALDMGSVGYTLNDDIHRVSAEWFDIRFKASKAAAFLAE